MKLELATTPQPPPAPHRAEAPPDQHPQTLESLRRDHKATSAEFATTALLLVRHTNSLPVRARRFLSRNPDIRNGKEPVTTRQVELNKQLASLAAQSHSEFIRMGDLIAQNPFSIPESTNLLENR